MVDILPAVAGEELQVTVGALLGIATGDMVFAERTSAIMTEPFGNEVPHPAFVTAGDAGMFAVRVERELCLEEFLAPTLGEALRSLATE